MLEFPRSILVEEPRLEDPALASFHPLLLALCRRTRHFPSGDPFELGLGLRATALSAAEAVLAACALRGLPLGFAAAVADAVRRLRELSCCIEIARRLGYLDEQLWKDLLALHARTFRAVTAMPETPEPTEITETAQMAQMAQITARDRPRRAQACAASTRRAASLSQ